MTIHTYKMRNGAIAVVFLSALSCPLAAQEPARPAPPASIEDAKPLSLEARAATAVPSIGEAVIDRNGVLSPRFKRVELCQAHALSQCRSFIFDTRTDTVAQTDGVWSEAYLATGRGQEVLRVKEFSQTERSRPAQAFTPKADAPRLPTREEAQALKEAAQQRGRAIDATAAAGAAADLEVRGTSDFGPQPRGVAPAEGEGPEAKPEAIAE